MTENYEKVQEAIDQGNDPAELGIEVDMLDNPEF